MDTETYMVSSKNTNLEINNLRIKFLINKVKIRYMNIFLYIYIYISALFIFSGFIKSYKVYKVQSPHKWWSTLKSAVFGSGSSLPPLVGPGGGLVCESVGKAGLLSDHFDSKQARESVDLLVTCHPSPCLITFAFRSSEVKRLLLDLDP